MYLYHFGLTELPFNLTPDTDFYCELPVYGDAMNVLRVALESGEGFVKVIGEVGTGKTMLCRMLLNYLESRAKCAYLPNPYLSPNELRLALASELSIRVARTIDQYQLTEKINKKIMKFQQEGKPVVVIVDEAQALPRESLEALRLFTNLETEKRKLLQVVLFAQPELDTRLAKPDLRQLRQRISFSCNLKPLDLASIRVYLNHRLRAAGLTMERLEGGELFTPSAIKILLKRSRGIPRLVNVLAHKSMMLAYGKGQFKIDASDVKGAAKDTGDVTYHHWLWGLLVALGLSGSLFGVFMAGWLP
ncbi:MAG: AAA family ATPase [Gammaproteobacteria bacterium]|nr:MAG: AAA family ATPase [Gammaproteobacteria bacterium]